MRRPRCQRVHLCLRKFLCWRSVTQAPSSLEQFSRSSFSPDSTEVAFTIGEDFASTVFLGGGFGVGLGVCFGVGFGVAFAFGVGLAVGLRAGVDVAVAFGVGNWISLFAAVRRDFSSSGSSDFNGVGLARASKTFTGNAAALLVSAARFSALPIQTTLCAFEGLLVCRLQRINPTRKAICASAIRVTFRQKRASFDIVYFVSALVAMPTLVICARCIASIKLINFCTGNSRSGRITTATSGFLCFISSSRALSVSGSTI